MKRQMVDMLAELVKIPSDPFSDKQEVLDYVQSFTDQLRMRNTLFGDAQAPALLAESGQSGVVLSGHLDTPPIGDYWSFSQSQLASGRMYGRGAADMKGTVVAMLEAAEDLVAGIAPQTTRPVSGGGRHRDRVVGVGHCGTSAVDRDGASGAAFWNPDSQTVREAQEDAAGLSG